MAAIDKIYVNTWEEYVSFKNWCKEQPSLYDKYGVEVKLTRYLYNYTIPFTGCHPVFNAPYYVDAYVIRNCPFDFIQKELMINYGQLSQERIDDAYKIVMERGGQTCEPGDFYYWLSEKDFEIVDGVVTMPHEKESTYSQIKRGLIYNSPLNNVDYIPGKHFKCVKHPVYFYNRPYKSKSWFVDVIVPKELPYMWYHENHNSWDFNEDFVVSEWSSSIAYCKTIRALKRLMIKWKLPIGTVIRVTGRYSGDYYEFIIKK